MVVHSYFPKDIRVIRYVGILNEMNIPVDVICIGEEGDKTQQPFFQGEIIRKILPKKRSGKLRYIYEYLVFWLFAKKKINLLISKYHYTAIHVHTLPDFLVFTARRARKKGITIILDLHEVLPEFYSVKFNVKVNGFIFKLLKFIERKSVNYADFAITVTSSLQKLIGSRTQPKNDLILIMNTVDKELHRKREFMPHEGFNLFYTGTVLEISNLDLIIKALANIDNPNIAFHIVGTGPQLQKLKALTRELNLENRVFLYGQVQHSVVPDLLSICDAGVIPQKRNIFTDMSFANKLAEFVFHEIPVIATELTSTKDYFRDISVCFTESGSIESMQAAIEKLYSSPETCKKLCINALEDYQAIEWEVMKDRYKELIKKIIQNK